MKFSSLSELAGQVDTNLVSLHDSLHRSGKSSSFLRWYHSEIVVEMQRRGLAHYEMASVLDKHFDLMDYELVTGKSGDNHSHTAMLDQMGEGFTDPVNGHYHLVIAGSVHEQSDGHSHELDLPDEIKAQYKIITETIDEYTAASKNAIEKMSLGFWDISVAGGELVEFEGHTHSVVILDTDKGFGRSGFESSHSHWVLDWNVQEVDGHIHQLDKNKLHEINGIFEPIKSASQKQVIKTEPVPVEHLLDESVGVEFGKPCRVKTAQKKAFSAEEAWALWGSDTKSILVTSMVYGLPLQAHIKHHDGKISVQMFVDGSEITSHFNAVASALRFIHLKDKDEVVLAGVLTTKFDRNNAESILREAINGGSPTAAVFFVEDCWYRSGSLADVTVEERRHHVQNLLAGATLPVLKQLISGSASGEQKALRITEQALAFDGAFAARWRSSDSTLTGSVEEIVVCTR